MFPIDLLVKSSGQFTVCIFVDLVATFDTMNHCLLEIHFPSFLSLRILLVFICIFGFLLSFLQRNFLEETPLCLSQSAPTVSPLITNLPPKLHHVYFHHLRNLSLCDGFVLLPQNPSPSLKSSHLIKSSRITRAGGLISIADYSPKIIWFLCSPS